MAEVYGNAEGSKASAACLCYQAHTKFNLRAPTLHYKAQSDYTEQSVFKQCQ